MSAPFSARSFSSSSSRSLARMIISGRLAGEPSLHTTQSGSEILRYTVSTFSGTKKNPHISYYRIATFPSNEKQRDYILGLPKGSLVYVETDASLRNFEDVSDGKLQQRLNLIQRHLQVIARARPHEEPEDQEEPQNYGSEEH